MQFTPPFGAWIKNRRKSLGLTQAELAKSINYSIVTIHKIEAGDLRPSQQIAECLAGILDIHPGERAAFIAFARGIVTNPVHANLPVPPTPLIGRDQDIAAVSGLLEQDNVRLLTLFGPPGVGKTRLAIDVVRFLSHKFADGVCFVSLAPITDPALVSSTISAALGAKVGMNQFPIESMMHYLRDRHLLMLLDNFEQLLAAAPLIANLVVRAPRLKVLVTSRAVLRLSAEYEFEVLPLPCPLTSTVDQLRDADAMRKYAAVELFVQRAKAADSGFALNRTNAPAVAEICQRVDGLPLALELAAERIRVFSPQAILARLDHHMGATMRLLTVGPRDLPQRQQTLRATIDWSYQLLNDEEQTLFRRLGVFVGGCTLKAAVAVCGAEQTDDSLISNLQSLIEKSLMRKVDGFASEPRYVMLETIRQFAHDRLVDVGELEGAMASHFQYFSKLAGEVAQHVGGAEEKYWLDILESELDNLREALGWVEQTGDRANAKLLLTSLLVFWLQRGYSQEGLAWAITLMAKLGELDQITLLRGMAYLALRRGDLGQSLDYTTQAHSLALHLEDEELMLETTLDLAEYPQDYEHGKANLEHALRLACRTGKQRHIYSLLFHLGWLLLEYGEFDQAAAALTELLALDPAEDGFQMEGKSPTLTMLGILAYARGDYVQARTTLEQSLRIARQVENRVLVADALVELANVMLYLNDCAPVPTALKEAISTFQWMGNTERVAQCLAVAARLAHMHGQPERAVRLLASTANAYAHKQRVVCEHTMFYQDYERQLTVLRIEVDPVIFDKSWAEGQSMTLEQAIEYALHGAEMNELPVR